MKNYAIIPARSGSKRIPGKNTRKLNSEPIIVHVIKKLINTGLFDEVIVSTDSEEIASISEAAGGKVPFIRPEEFSGDNVSTQAVIQHALRNVDFGNAIITCVYPTSVLLELEDLIKAETLLKEKIGAEFILAAYEPPSSPLRSFTRSFDGKINMLFPEYYESRSQDLPRTFVDSGLFYLAFSGTWLTRNNIFGENSYIVEIPQSRGIDINTEEDWEAMVAKYNRGFPQKRSARLNE